MKNLILALVLSGCAYGADFDPKDILDAAVVAVAPCPPYDCVVAVKDGKRYLVAFKDGDIVRVYLIVDEDAQLLYAKDLI